MLDIKESRIFSNQPIPGFRTSVPLCVCVCVGVCVCFVWGGASLDVILCLDVQVSAALATAESLRTLAPQQQEPGVGGASGNLMGTKINSE